MAFGDQAPTGKYIKCETEVELAVVGDEVTGHATWDPGARKYVAGDNFRFGVHAWTTDSGLGLLQGGWRLYKALTDAVKTGGQDCLYRVVRHGTGMSTQFTVTRTRGLSAGEQEAIGASPMFDLGQEFPWAGDDTAGEPARRPNNDEVPF